MKKLSVIALALILTLSTLLIGCSSQSAQPSTTSGSSAAEDQSLNYIMDKGELIVGLDDAFPPMGYRDENNELIGFDIDLAKEVGKRMGVEVKLQPISWAAKEQEIASKNIDCIWNGFGITPERQEVLTITEPYLSNPQIYVVLAKSGIKTEADLAGKRVAAQSGSTAYSIIDKNTELKDSFKEFIGIEDNVKALMDLEVGGSDAVAMDTIVARYYMAKDPEKYSIVEDTTIFDEEVGVGFRKGDEALCAKVEEILKEMQADGTLAKISEQWFGEDITTIGK